MSILRSPEPWLLATLLAIWPALAQADDLDFATQRARIARERKQVQADYLARERECRQHFVVTPCLERASQQRRLEIERLDHEKGVLDDTERKQRAAKRMERIQRKQAAAQGDVVAEPAPEPQPQPASAPPRKAAAKRERERRAPGVSESEQADNESAYERRQQKAAEHRKAVEARNAKRKPVAPLPVPPEVPASKAVR
jgi:hypothetical protein